MSNHFAPQLRPGNFFRVQCERFAFMSVMAMVRRWLFSLVLFTFSLFAQDYGAFVADIERRLDNTEKLYAEGKSDEAKRAVQMAYFEVFENLEGPIRINISAKKSATMEAEFGNIRKLINNGAPQEEVKGRLAALKKEVRDVLPSLESGHKLTAENGLSAEVDPGWASFYQVIDDNLAQAMSAFERGNGSEAKRLVQLAQYEGFKNSNMETLIRQHSSAAAEGRINRAFAALMRQADSQDKPHQFGYSITSLLDELQDALKGVPAPVTASDDSGAAAGEQKDWTAVREELFTALDKALGQYEGGDKEKAVLAVQDSYFDIFEASGMESAIGARDSAFKTELEGHFTKLVALMNSGKGRADLDREMQAFATNMERAVASLSGSQGGLALFFYSLTIILREGLEALLIVAAIIAYLIKNGHGDKLKVIRGSVWWALAASVVTALLFQWFFTNAAASREILEGVTMLIAVVMLFFMSYWLLSKVEAQHWKQYLQDKLGTSLSKNSLYGLWATSFLAVYREGAETVLFYFALAADAKSALDYGYLLAGFAVGAVILFLVYLVMRFSTARLPLKPFFMATGIFMYLMAFIFAGKGVAELIEGKAFTPTLLFSQDAIPAWASSWLGIYPYWETLIPQLVLVLAALFALWVLFFRRPTPSKTLKQEESI